MTPIEWRGVRVGAKLIRLSGGKAILSSATKTKVVVSFPNKTKVEMGYPNLYLNYKPA